ncbi:MAG TPA: ATP-binding protein [Candidatus Limnocylindria bacterium]|jgi:hypothetical protein|nr:ATP-binding protein [Candidatus Limnocylindria bacterium]
MTPDIARSLHSFLAKGCRLKPIKAEIETFLEGSDDRGFKLASSDEKSKSPLKLMVEGHFEVTCDGLVIDRKLGALGLIQVLDCLNFIRPLAVKEKIVPMLEQAAHIRHILGLKRTEAVDPLAAYLPVVEVVLIACAPARKHGMVLEALRDGLRECLQDSGLLHSVSVNLAVLEAGRARDPRSTVKLRRAFCWLLTSTARWFNRMGSPHCSPISWDRLELDNFRTPGKRRWQRSGSQRLHVFHGPNGSGKSSLAEGFEFVVTGNSLRLPSSTLVPDPKERFRSLVCGRHPNKGARVSLVQGDVSVMARHVGRAKPDDTPATKGLHGGSLRLEQQLCDKLARENATTRARLWMETFFGDRDKQRLRRAEAGETLLGAIEQLEPGLTPHGKETAVKALVHHAEALLSGKSVTVGRFLGRFGVLAGEVARKSPGADGLHLPVTLAARLESPSDDRAEVNRWWSLQRDELAKRLSASLEHDLEELARWESANLPELGKLLKRLGQDVFGDSSSYAALGDHERRVAYDRWLHTVALSDLLEKALAIAGTFQHASEPARAAIAGLVPSLSAERIRDQLKSIREERDGLRQRLGALSNRPGAGDHTKARHRTDSIELGQFLDAVRAGTFEPLLGRDHESALREAFDKRQFLSLADFSVGEEGWTQRLMALLRVREGVLAKRGDAILAKVSVGKSIREEAHKRANAVVELITRALDVATFESKAAEDFFAQLQSSELGAAIDELVAVLTPARWAYDPIKTCLSLSPEGKTADEKLEFKAHDMDVAQILNTAELNALSLTLYLLCAPRVDNPYRVVFLDDPLQNMDELTVITVARSLARLMRLWSGHEILKQWHFVLLLHSEEDCERILIEAPAAFYRIPWMAPLTTPETKEDQVEIIEEIPCIGGGAGTLFNLQGFLTGK